MARRRTQTETKTGNIRIVTWSRRLLPPQALRCDAGALGHRLELGPGDLRVAHARPQPAVRARDDVLAADDARVGLPPVRDQLRVLHDVRVVADHAGDKDLAVRQLRVLPHLPLMVVSRVSGLDGVGLRLYLEDNVG